MCVKATVAITAFPEEKMLANLLSRLGADAYV